MNWFAEFLCGNSSLQGALRFGRPTEIDKDQWLKLAHYLSKTIVDDYLKQFGYLKKLDTWPIHFWKDWWLTIINGSCTVMFSEKDHGVRLVNYLKPHQKSIKKRLCYRCGITRELCFCYLTQQLSFTYTLTINQIERCPEAETFRIRKYFFRVSCHLHHVALTLHHQTTTCFALWKVLWKTFTLDDNVIMQLGELLLKKVSRFMKREL